MKRVLFYFQKATLIFLHRYFWPRINVHYESNHELFKKRLTRAYGPQYVFYYWIWGLLDGDNVNSRLFDDFADLDWDINHGNQILLFKECEENLEDTSKRINQVLFYDLSLFLNYYLRLSFLPHFINGCRNTIYWIFTKLYIITLKL